MSTGDEAVAHFHVQLAASRDKPAQRQALALRLGLAQPEPDEAAEHSDAERDVVEQQD
jgi:hypothetical protein